MTKNRTSSSRPTLLLAAPRSFRTPAIRANGLSSSCQTRMSSPKRISSRARASSNAGQIQAGAPVAGMTMANARSDGCQSTAE